MKLTYMASTTVGWKRMGETPNGGTPPRVIDISACGRHDHDGNGMHVDDFHTYHTKIEKSAINSELLGRGYDFTIARREKMTFITRMDGVFIVHDWVGDTFTREA